MAGERPTISADGQGLWRAVVALIGAIGVLVFVVLGMAGGFPQLPESAASSRSEPSIPLALIERILHLPEVSAVNLATNLVSPFQTTHFVPPPPKPQLTRKIDLTYQGFFDVAGGDRRAFVKVGDGVFVGPKGGKVVSDWFVSEIALKSLTVTNATQTNVLQFNAKKEFEIPAQ